MSKKPEIDPLELFHLEAMRLRDSDVELLRQMETKTGAELVAFVCDWWGTRSHQILLEMREGGRLDERALQKVSRQIKAQEQTSWRDLPDEWRRQFGVSLEL